MIFQCVKLGLISQPASSEKFPCLARPLRQAQMRMLFLHRQNTFRVAGSVAMPLGKCHVRASNGNLIPVTAQKLIVSAFENFGGKPVEIALALPPTPEVVDTEHFR